MTGGYLGTLGNSRTQSETDVHNVFHLVYDIVQSLIYSNFIEIRNGKTPLKSLIFSFTLRLISYGYALLNPNVSYSYIVRKTGHHEISAIFSH